MSDMRLKNVNWNCGNGDGRCQSVDHAQLAVLMDIRDELQTLNALLRCRNFLNIPDKLDAIRRNTAPKKPKKKTSAK